MREAWEASFEWWRKLLAARGLREYKSASPATFTATRYGYDTVARASTICGSGSPVYYNLPIYSYFLCEMKVTVKLSKQMYLQKPTDS